MAKNTWVPRLSVAALLLWVSSVQALFFYLDGTTPKCFYEELPKDTLVVGTYKAESYNQDTQQFYTNNQLMIHVSVDETFDSDHRVVNQKTTSSDKPARFTFTAADAGLHRICFTPSGPGAVSVAGWFTSGPAGSTLGGVKLSLDMAIGENSKIESSDKHKVDSMVQRVVEMNARLHDVRKEQMYQREREAAFRDQSESTNSKIVRYTLVQLVVLGGTCAWQLSHLRAFFIKQKLT